MTTALLYNLRFCFLPLLYLFTLCFKPCFVGCYGSFSVVATSFLHDGRQKCLLGMQLSIWMWKGLKRLISGYLQQICLSATWNSLCRHQAIFFSCLIILKVSLVHTEEPSWKGRTPKKKSTNGFVCTLDLPSTRWSEILMQQKAQNFNFLCAIELLDSSVVWTACRKAQEEWGTLSLECGVSIISSLWTIKNLFLEVLPPEGATKLCLRGHHGWGSVCGTALQLPRASKCKEVSANPEAEFYL